MRGFRWRHTLHVTRWGDRPWGDPQRVVIAGVSCLPLPTPPRPESRVPGRQGPTEKGEHIKYVANVRTAGCCELGM
jgi:hypothetical protein